MKRGAYVHGDADIWRLRINQNWDFLVDQLACLSDVMDHLIASSVFSHADVDAVLRADVDRTERATNRRFLRRLLQKDGDAYKSFIKALEKTYSDHIVEKLESTDISRLSATGVSSSSPLLTADDTYGGAMAVSGGQKSMNVTSVTYISHAKNVFLPSQSKVNMADGPSFSTGVESFAGVHDLCPESLVVALLKEILYHCPRRKEAMFTLEDKLCSKLSETSGKRIVSFKEHFQTTFREFLDKHSEHFEISWHEGEYIVSRVKENPYKCVGEGSILLEDKKQDTEKAKREQRNLTQPGAEVGNKVSNSKASQQAVTHLAAFQGGISDYTSASRQTEKASTGADLRESSENLPPSDLMKAVKHFRKGHFILLCGTLPYPAPNLDALACVPWIAVYDFDVGGMKTGLLAYMEHGLRQRRSTRVFTWMDPHTAVTERGTQWWSLRGRVELPESNLSELQPMKWLKKVCEKLEKLCTELGRLTEDYTVLSVLVIWPRSKDEMKCMQKFLNELQKRILTQPFIFLCFTNPETDKGGTFEVQSILEDSEGSVWKGNVNLGQFCSEVALTFSSADRGSFKHELPGETTPVEISVEEAAWLTQDFEVLYLQNPYTHKEMTAEDLKARGDIFFRGGSLSWLARYEMGSTCFDIERCLSRDITRHITKLHIEGFRGGVVHILHAPGSGGSTTAQRILFDLHEVAPCVHIKRCLGSTVDDVAERLLFLADRTHMPVVALFDGEDDQKLQHLSNQLGHSVIIFIHVKRHPYYINTADMHMKHRNVFFVAGHVTKRESRNLIVQYQAHCCNSEGKRRALKSLDEDVQRSRQGHQMFEYGLTVFNHEFRGVQAYVRGYLQIGHSELEHWQKCLGYLALVYYYAQASLPCYFIGNIIGGSAKPVYDIHDLPFPVQMLVVPDINEDRQNYIRIMHYTVAQEILEQILTSGSHRTGTDNLSEAAKQNLKHLCLDFLNDVGGSTSRASFTLQSVLTKTFIIRDVGDMAETKTAKEKPKFSAVLQDMDSEPPYRNRLEVLQKLCEICPEDASLRAHLGRFYSLCRPEQEKEAEDQFKEAVKMVTETGHHQNTVELIYIYHMYGCFLQRKMKRRIEKSSQTCPYLDIIKDAERACQNFSSSRNHAFAAMREALQYFCEIDVRLQVCRFINRSFPGGLQAVLQPDPQTDIEVECSKFTTRSIVEIQDLLMECSNRIHLDEVSLATRQEKVIQFNNIFKGLTRQLQAMAEDDPVTCLRLKVTAKKLEYTYGNTVFVENPEMPASVMTYVVNTLEEIFVQDSAYLVLKDKLELDYRDWILAIRNPRFPKTYSVEEVMDNVRRWSRSVKGVQQSLAIFYRFVLTSLRVLGTPSSPGSEQCLGEALQLLKEVRQESRADPKARLPREWLGSERESGIRQLVSQGFVPMDDHQVKPMVRHLLAVCKGTVQKKSKKPWGFICIDLPRPQHRGDTCSIQAFFTLRRAEAVKPVTDGKRVQFYLAFTQENGYEAYEVTPLERTKCQRCGLWVEITRDRTSLRCPGTTGKGKPCNTDVFRKDHG